MKTKKTKSYPSRASQVLVNQAMLYKVRDELKSSLNALDLKIEARLTRMESKLEGMASAIHRIALLVEEQNSKNNVVLDGLTVLFGRQERVESKVEDFQKTILSIIK